jgi:hypothetical protein
MAGAPGFEPGDGGTKNRCLTAWLRPNENAPFIIACVRIRKAGSYATMHMIDTYQPTAVLLPETRPAIAFA